MIFISTVKLQNVLYRLKFNYNDTVIISHLIARKIFPNVCVCVMRLEESTVVLSKKWGEEISSQHNSSYNSKGTRLVMLDA